MNLRTRLMVRVAGLPADTLEPLRSPAALAWAEDVLSEETRLRGVADEVADGLHDAIGGLDEARTRQALIRLRREVFNNRLPADLDAALALAERLAPPLRESLGAWLRRRTELAERLADGAGLLDRELAVTRTALRALAAEERLRAGLLLAAPALDAQLDDFVAGRLPLKRARKVERSLLSYVYRSAVKTSPFSTFTAVALGRFGGPAAQPAPDRWISAVRLNVVVVARLFEAVRSDSARLGDLPVALASGWERDGDRVRYVRRSILTGDDSASVTFDAARDQLFFLRRSRVLDRLLSRFDDSPVMTYRELTGWLSVELGTTAQESERYAADLVDLGILRMPLFATHVHTADPLRSFQAALRSLWPAWAHRLTEDLELPARCVEAYATASLDERRHLLGELRAGLRAALDGLSGEPTSTLPQTVLYEDVSAGELHIGGTLDAGRLAGRLASVERLLPAFDLSLRHKLTLHGFFLARYGPGGRCDDLTRLVHEFHEDVYDEYRAVLSRRPNDGALLPDPNWLHVDAVAALDSARATFASELTALTRAHPQAAEISLDGLVAPVSSALHPVRPRLSALTHYLQIVPATDRPADPLVVHNGAFGGLSFPFSRFTHCFLGGDSGVDLAAEVRRANRALQPEATVFAEVTGGAATTNLNLHAPLVDYEIVGPGEGSSRPADRRIELDDLSLTHDAEADRLVLRSRKLDREVIPVYFGYLIPQALPAVSQTLLLLSPSATIAFDPWAGVPDPEPDQARERVVHRPRLVLDGVVLSRRSWRMLPGDLPLGAPGEPAHERFLAWQRWRLRHGIPAEVFARVPGANASHGRLKPQYVDLTSPLSLLAVEAMVAGVPPDDPRSRVVLTERLPAADHLHVRSSSGPHVAELAVETVTCDHNAATGTARKAS